MGREAVPRVVVGEHLVPPAGERRQVVARIPHRPFADEEQVAILREVAKRPHAPSFFRGDLRANDSVFEDDRVRHRLNLAEGARAPSRAPFECRERYPGSSRVVVPRNEVRHGTNPSAKRTPHWYPRNRAFTRISSTML